jgi:hypothetical protein
MLSVSQQHPCLKGERMRGDIGLGTYVAGHLPQPLVLAGK